MDYYHGKKRHSDIGHYEIWHPSRDLMLNLRKKAEHKDQRSLGIAALNIDFQHFPDLNKPPEYTISLIRATLTSNSL